MTHAARFYKSTTAPTMAEGPKNFGGTKGMLLYFWRPRLTRKWTLWRLKPSFGPAKSIVLSPQILFVVPPKDLFCPLKFQNTKHALFIAIYALFGGTSRTKKKLWWGDRNWFIGLGATPIQMVFVANFLASRKKSNKVSENRVGGAQWSNCVNWARPSAITLWVGLHWLCGQNCWIL